MKSHSPTLTEHLLVNSGLILAFTLVASPFGYLLRIILSRSLTPIEYGLYYAVIGFFTLFLNFKDLGFGNAAVYFIPKFWIHKEYANTWLTFIYSSFIEIFVTSVLALAAIFGSGFLSQHYFKSELSLNLLPIFATVFVVESFVLAFKRLFIALNKVRFYSVFEPLRFGTAFFLSLYLFLTNQASLLAFSYIWLASYIVTLALGGTLFFLSLKHIVSWPTWNMPLFKKLKTYAIPTVFGHVVHQLNNNTDVLFLTLVKGVTTVGVYNVTFPIIIIPSMLFSPLTRLFMPIMSSLQEMGSKEKIEHFIESVLKVTPLISLYFNAFIFLFAETSLATLFTYKWVAVAKVPLMWMSVAYLGYILVSYLDIIIDGLGLVRQKVKITSSLALINILITPISIYYFDLVGLVLVNGVAQLLLTFFYTRLLKKHYTIKIPYASYLSYLLFFGFLIFIVKVTHFVPVTFISFMLSGVLYTVIVGIFAHSQQLVDQQTLAILKNKFSSFSRKIAS